jgi:hypothetical protein
MRIIRGGRVVGQLSFGWDVFFPSQLIRPTDPSERALIDPSGAHLLAAVVLFGRAPVALELLARLLGRAAEALLARACGRERGRAGARGRLLDVVRRALGRAGGRARGALGRVRGVLRGVGGDGEV